MKNIYKHGISMVLLVPVGWIILFASTVFGLTADEIMERADRIRNPGESYYVLAQITSIRPDAEERVEQYEVFVKGRDKTAVRTIYPKMQRGRNLLMRGYDLWFYLPKIRKPVRISLQQRLLGQVSNGDIVRADFSGDYKASILRTEVIDGLEYYVLDLLARNRRVTYNRIWYWVNKNNHRPLKAEFYTLSDKLLKTCHFTEYKFIAGDYRPVKMVIEDNLLIGHKSILEYLKIERRNFPDKIFNKNYLDKL